MKDLHYYVLLRRRCRGIGWLSRRMIHDILSEHGVSRATRYRAIRRMEYSGFLERSGKGYRILSLRWLSRGCGRLSIPIDKRFVDDYKDFVGVCLQTMAEMKQGQFQHVVRNDHEHGCSVRTLSKESGYSMRHIRRLKSDGKMFFVKNTDTKLFTYFEGRMNGDLKKQLDDIIERMEDHCPRHAKVCCNVTLKEHSGLPEMTYVHAYYQLPDVFTRIKTAEPIRKGLDDVQKELAQSVSSLRGNRRYTSSHTNLVKKTTTQEEIVNHIEELFSFL